MNESRWLRNELKKVLRNMREFNERQGGALLYDTIDDQNRRNKGKEIITNPKDSGYMEISRKEVRERNNVNWVEQYTNWKSSHAQEEDPVGVTDGKKRRRMNQTMDVQAARM